MIILYILLLLFVGAGFITFKYYTRILKEEKCKYGDTGTGFGVGLAWSIILFVVVLSTILTCSINVSINHKNDYNNLARMASNKRIYDNKYQMIGAELKTELNKYSIHEKEVFDKMSPDKIALYFVKYPELRSVESITLLAQQLASLQSKIYDTDLEYNNVVLVMKKRQENKWWYGFWLKTYDVDFK